MQDIDMCMSRLVHVTVCPANPIRDRILIVLEGINNETRGLIAKWFENSNTNVISVRINHQSAQ